MKIDWTILSKFVYIFCIVVSVFDQMMASKSSKSSPPPPPPSPSPSPAPTAAGGASSSSASGPGGPAPGEPGEIYQFKITLEGTKPPIWRRVQVAADDDDMTFDLFHRILNSCMGWDNYHCYQFMYNHTTIMGDVQGGLFGPVDSMWVALGMAGPRAGDATVKSKEITVKEVFKDQGVKKVTYEYDFGDGWSHKVILEKMVPRVEGRQYPHCISGRRSCPPEDSHGVDGYYELLEKLADPTHEEHQEMKDWMEGCGRENFDPNHFSVADVNEKMQFDYLMSSWETDDSDSD